MTERYQNVIIILTDGRKGVFTGEVLVNESDENSTVKIASIEFTKSADLPVGMTFKKLGDDDGKNKNDS